MDSIISDEIPILDRTVISRLMEFDPQGTRGLIKRLVTLYLETLPVVLATLNRDAELSDLEHLKKEAHRFKSSSATLGLMRMREMLRVLEENALSPSESQVLIRILNEESKRAIQELQTIPLS